jgi:hypothetical protein
MGIILLSSKGRRRGDSAGYFLEYPVSRESVARKVAGEGPLAASEEFSDLLGLKL